MGKLWCWWGLLPARTVCASMLLRTCRIANLVGHESVCLFVERLSGHSKSADMYLLQHDYPVVSLQWCVVVPACGEGVLCQQLCGTESTSSLQVVCSCVTRPMSYCSEPCVWPGHLTVICQSVSTFAVNLFLGNNVTSSLHFLICLHPTSSTNVQNCSTMWLCKTCQVQFAATSSHCWWSSDTSKDRQPPSGQLLPQSSEPCWWIVELSIDQVPLHKGMQVNQRTIALSDSAVIARCYVRG